MDLVKSHHLSGAIGTFVSDEWVSRLTEQNVAAVNLFNFSKIRSIPSIGLDDSAIGTEAARHLAEQGAKSFTFIGQDEAYFNRIRRKSFIQSCPENSYRDIHPRESRRTQTRQLGDLDKPIGVLCSNDRIARELCNEVELLKMKPGKDLLIVGIGNEPSESTFAGIGLSSFDIPARTIGYLAAQQMEISLEAGTNPHETARPSEITANLIIRESTLASPRARLAERTMKLILESVSEPDADITKISGKLGVSRRSLELTTRQQFGKSPYQILSEQRLNKAKELLSQTYYPIAEIGERCGYPEPHHFSAWFKKKVRVSPRSYRTQYQNENPTTTAPVLQEPQTPLSRSPG